jgi:hypothetical protein
MHPDVPLEVLFDDTKYLATASSIRILSGHVYDCDICTGEVGGLNCSFNLSFDSAPHLCESWSSYYAAAGGAAQLAVFGVGSVMAAPS